METPESQEFVVVEDKDLDDYDAGILPQSLQVIADIKKWLQPTDYLADSSEYNKHLHNHVKGTGLWIQETEAYRKWHDSPHQGSIWVKAIAGAGKSVFAAMIAEKLSRTEQVPVLSFFFRQIIATNHDPQYMARDWISMILENSPPLQARMKKYMDDHRALDSITTNEFWQDLVHALVSMPKVYCIVDALDEMDIDQQDFFINLVNLGKRKPASIKLLMTSRPLPRIEASMKDPSVLQVRLEQSKVDTDIAIYVRHRLRQRNNVNAELRAAIGQAVGEKAQGSFLYARLMMDELLDHLQQMTPNLDSIRRSLSWLPNSLEDMYNGMLLDHSLRSCVPQNLQLTILQWVTHSTRPLRLLELASMLDSQNKPDIKVKGRQDTKAVVRTACGPLLEILEDETVSVIHHSFTEFLVDTERLSRPTLDDQHPQFPVIDPATTHKDIAIACLNYLPSALRTWKLPISWATEFDDEDNYYRGHRGPAQRIPQGNIKMEEPFLDYASSNWFVHVRDYGSFDAELLSRLDDFMDIKSHGFRAWLDMKWPAGEGMSQISTIHVSAWAGLSWYTKKLLGEGAESNCLDGRERTPLSYAAGKGFAEVVALLLDYVEDPDVACCNGLKPIHYAAQGNHHKVVRLLIQAGVSPLTGKTRDPMRRCGRSQSSIGHTPLMYACQSGGVETVREMMPYLQPEDLYRALCWAARSGMAPVVDLILTSREVSIDGLDRSNTPLFLASAGLHFEAMRSLLKAGADPNRRCSNTSQHPMRGHPTEDCHEKEFLGPMPLHALCGVMSHNIFGGQTDEENIKKCFKLLLDAGCDINAIDTANKTPLHYAMSRKSRGFSSESELVSSLLLQNGADPSISDNNGDTPLHLLKLQQESSILIEPLLRHGGSLTVRRPKDGRTPVHTIMDSVHTMDIKPLLPYVQDWNVQDGMGLSPLHIVLSTSYNPGATVKDLIQAGADLNLRNRNGEVPHLLVRDLAIPSPTPILPILLDAGADLESTDNLGRTILLRTMFGSHMNSIQHVQALLDLGAKVDIVDHDGNGVLHAICKTTKNVALIQVLVDAGADPLRTNHRGNNLLHESLSSYNPDCEKVECIINALFDLGVSTSARNHQGRTPLHVAYERLPSEIYFPKTDSLDTILRSKLGESINCFDNDGIRPIHLAATLSEHLVAKLIKYGADPTATTYEQKNVLHIAARAKRVNTIGYLLEHLSSLKKIDMINSIDDEGRSPLHYACRSGRIETVALLLEFGANVDICDKAARTPLHACAEFEEEKVLWSISIDARRQNEINASGILNSDMTRPVCGQLNSPRVKGLITDHKHTERIREIVKMLINHGSEALPQGIAKSHTPLSYAIALECSEMVDELSTIKQRFQEESGLRVTPEFMERNLISLCHMHVLEDDLEKDGDDSDFCNSLLARGHFSAIESLLDVGVDFAPRVGKRMDFMTTLAQFGYFELFEKLGSAIKEPGWINGLYSVNSEERKLVQPYLVTAARSSLPNLAVMKVIVEKFGADVNIRPEVRIYRKHNQQDIRPAGGVLHLLAESMYWWQTRGIEYLLEHGADINLKNENGQTPLFLAVSNDRPHQTYRGFHTAELLLKCGADPNILDNSGLSCLNKAMHDAKLVRLLLENGADIMLGEKPALISAIAAQDVAAVSAILESGADPNARRKPPPTTIKTKSSSPIARGVFNPRDFEYYPIHFAASSKFNTTKTRAIAIEIIKLLLSKGANVFLTYEDNSEVSKGGTVLHEIFRNSGIIQPFLEMPSLDLERRNEQGKTLLLAACASPAGTCSPIDSPAANRQFGMPYGYHQLQLKDKDKDPPPCHAVFLRGGDLAAVDNEGNNALHLLFPTISHYQDVYQKAFIAFVSEALQLVDMPNKAGWTPLHLALQKRRWWGVQALLDAGANPLNPDPEGNTAMHHLAGLMCSGNGTPEWLAWFDKFLSLGININAKNAVGETCLFRYFAAAASREWADQRVEAPCKVDKSLGAHRHFYTPFREAGADILTRNNQGQTLLHIIPKQRSSLGSWLNREAVDTFKFLMEEGVDPMAEDSSQRTALDVAAAVGCKVVLNIFKRENGSGAVPAVRILGASSAWDSDDSDESDL